MKKIFILIAILALTSITLAQTTQTSVPETKDFKWLMAKIDEAKQKLANVHLLNSNEVRTYITRTKYKSGSSVDWFWKEVGLAAIDLDTGDIVIIKIRKDRQNLYVLNPGYEVNFEPGKSWNNKNTPFRVLDNKDKKRVVLAIKWVNSPDTRYVFVKKGKRTIRVKKFVSPIPLSVTYVPYSRGLHLQDLILAGQVHFQKDVKEAFAKLDKLGVRSLVEPGKLITQRFEQITFERIGLMEQSDPGEFNDFTGCGCIRLGLPDKDITSEMKNNLSDISSAFNPFERVYVRLGVNGEDEFKSRNFAGAVGQMQFTNNGKRGRPGTWDVVRSKYPLAQLPNFQEGATDHVFSIMAAVLLHDLNTLELVQKFDHGILQDKDLLAYLAAGYNGGIGPVITAIKKGGANWRKYLKTRETRIYVAEWDWLQIY